MPLPSPVLQSLPGVAFALAGELGRRLAAVTEQWLLPAPFANPGMLEMFRNRDRQPYQEQTPWAGEFAGKYLTHAVQILRLTRDPRLTEHLRWFVGELVALQADNGYLGPWPEAWQLRKGAPTCATPWDAWGHYHAMVGLLLWHQDSGDERALRCVCRIADLLCDRFLDSPMERLHDTGAQEMNQAPVHALAWLYRLTGEARYLRLAEQIVAEFAIPPAGDYLRAALAGTPFHATPKPRWESLHPIMGLVELHYATGRPESRQAFEQLWWSMLEGDRHNNGGFTSGERATGNPYDQGPIETCCTVAWMAMSVEMLRLTGNPVVADELELSMLNSGLGMMSPAGRWVTYNTPMDGQRRASAHDIVFQARAGTPELNCCSVNGPRALGLLCEWAVMARADGLAVNYYGSGTTTVALAGGPRVRLVQATDYPAGAEVDLRVSPAVPAEFTLALRIPAWSEQTAVELNGRAVDGVRPGSYLELRRRWRRGDRVRLLFDFRPRLWVAGPWRPADDSRDLELEWTLFGPAPRTAADRDPQAPPLSTTVEPGLDGLTTTPATLALNGVAYDPVRVVSRGGRIACRDLFPAVPGLPVSVGFAVWESAEEETVDLVFAADWWIAWYLNGRLLYDNHQGGGNGGDLSRRDHVLSLPLRRGTNLLAFRLSGGSTRGCWLSIGRGPTRAETAARPNPERQYAASLYRGPILLACDPRHNGAVPELFPALNGAALELRPVEDPTWLKPWLLFEVATAAGGTLRLCDFASAGAAGNAYRSWLPVALAVAPEPAPFSHAAPLRTVGV